MTQALDWHHGIAHVWARSSAAFVSRRAKPLAGEEFLPARSIGVPPRRLAEASMLAIGGPRGAAGRWAAGARRRQWEGPASPRARQERAIGIKAAMLVRPRCQERRDARRATPGARRDDTSTRLSGTVAPDRCPGPLPRTVAPDRCPGPLPRTVGGIPLARRQIPWAALSWAAICCFKAVGARPPRPGTGGAGRTLPSFAGMG